jgi:hypothetical protein
MSEYQYYEFCNLKAPLTKEARNEMHALSTRAKVSTHGASYVYNYGNFKGNPKELLLKHFDVFFYISNWGSLQLTFKYANHEVNTTELKPYVLKHVIDVETQDPSILLDIHFSNEEGLGWLEAEEILPDLLPLYDEIKTGNYQFLRLVRDVSERMQTADFIERTNSLLLSEAEEAFFKYAEIDLKKFYE